MQKVYRVYNKKLGRLLGEFDSWRRAERFAVGIGQDDCGIVVLNVPDQGGE